MAEVLVGEPQNGGSVSAAAGDVVVICLQENPTTGYRWQIDGGGLTLMSDEFSAVSLAPGAGGERKLRFAVPEPGIFLVQATMRRAWGSGAAPQSQFRVTIQVR